jgi:hypothetical protein
MRVDLDQRKVAEREADAAARLLLDLLDRAERLPRVGAFVVAVLEDDRAACRAADVVEVGVYGVDARRELLSAYVVRRQNPTTWRMRTT